VHAILAAKGSRIEAASEEIDQVICPSRQTGCSARGVKPTNVI
jgi:hypothetical protein